MKMDKDKLNDHLLKTAIGVLDANQHQEDMGWKMSYNDAIDQAVKQVKVHAEIFGIEVDIEDIDNDRIWAGIQRDRNWR